MQKIYLILLCAGLFCVQSYAEPQKLTQEAGQPDYANLIPPGKLKEDLDFLFKTIEEIHPNMYAFISKEEFTPIKEKLYTQITQPMTRLNFLKIVAPVVAELKNGHTIIFLPLPPTPSEFTAFIQNGGKFFPLSIDWYEEKVILAKNYTPKKLPLGGTILQINSEKISKVIEKLDCYYSAEGRDFCPAMLEKDNIMRFLFWLEYGPIETLNLQIKSTEGKINNYEVKMMTFGEIKAEEDISKGTNSYRYLTECDTFYLKLDDWANWGRIAEFTKFCDEIFKEIQIKKASHLIIDLRNNPGGDFVTMEVFMMYLLNKPCQSFQGLSSLAVNKSRQFNDGSNPLRFDGSVYILVGENSTSASTIFPSIVKNSRIVTIVGQEPHEPLTLYSPATSFELPNTHLQATAPHDIIIAPGSKNDGRGVIPDYDVKQKPEDTAKGVDTVLQFTLDFIKKDNANNANKPAHFPR